MTLSPRDVSILIPAYGRAAMTRHAVRSALATHPGEIIVSDDAGPEDITSALRDLDTPTLRIIRQPVNLGLWRNHLALLREASRPWIKFLQTDDALRPDALEQLCRPVTNTTALVAALPVYQNLETGETSIPRRLDAPLRFSSDAYLERLLRYGNEPGRPSYTLFRKDVLPMSEDAWRNDMSCDLTANILAAARGDVVILPPGPVTCGLHPNRDGATQSFDLLAARLVNSIRFLAAHPDPRIRRFCAVYGSAEAVALVRVALGRRRRGDPIPPTALLAPLARLARAIPTFRALANLPAIARYLHYKFASG